MNKKQYNEVDIYKKEIIVEPIVNDINNDSKSDIINNITDINNDSNDIIITIDDTVDRINVPIILRLKPSTISKLDDIAYRTRRSRNYVAQKLFDQVLDTVKVKDK